MSRSHKEILMENLIGAFISKKNDSIWIKVFELFF